MKTLKMWISAILCAMILASCGEEPIVNPITTPEEAIAFINDEVYTQCTDILPAAVESMALDLTDIDTVTYHTGLTSVEGITDIILSESMIGSFAYSVLYVRTDGTKTEEIRDNIAANIDTRKWICVEAEDMASVVLDNTDIFFVMSDAERTEAVINAAVAAAEAKFTVVSEIE